MGNIIKDDMYASAGEFNWDAYSDGYNGKTLKRNKRVLLMPDGSKTKVYSHESYAQELYNMYANVPTTNFVAKDEIKNTVFTVTDIVPVSSTEVVVDTLSGSSIRIDLNKDKEYLKVLGCDSAEQFTLSIAKSPKFKAQVLASDVKAKVLGTNRISLWAGHKSKTENEFLQQIKTPSFAYYGHIDSVNGGGYIVDVNGIKCFMPGSQAQANRILDYNVLVGKTIPVMIDNYNENTGFIVSYKKYLKTILPGKIEAELSEGMAIDAEVTGSKNGNIFLQFADSDGEMIFTGLLPVDNQSDGIKEEITAGQMKPGSKWRMYIWTITEDNRIVFGDEPKPEKVESNVDETTVVDIPSPTKIEL